MAIESSDDETYGLVYFIGHGEAGPVKIGFTAGRDSMPRLRQLQTGSPENLKILGTVTAYASIERKIQALLAPHIVRGEWFEREAALLILQRLQNRKKIYESILVSQLYSIEISDPHGVHSDDDCDPLHVQISKDLLSDIAQQLLDVNTEQPLPFRAWLLTQTQRDDPIEDLAQDASSDIKFPSLGSLADYLSYIKSKTSNSAIIRSTIEAWIECDMTLVGIATRERDAWRWKNTWSQQEYPVWNEVKSRLLAVIRYPAYRQQEQSANATSFSPASHPP